MKSTHTKMNCENAAYKNMAAAESNRLCSQIVKWYECDLNVLVHTKSTNTLTHVYSSTRSTLSLQVFSLFDSFCVVWRQNVAIERHSLSAYGIPSTTRATIAFRSHEYELSRTNTNTHTLPFSHVHSFACSIFYIEFRSLVL